MNDNKSECFIFRNLKNEFDDLSLRTEKVSDTLFNFCNGTLSNESGDIVQQSECFLNDKIYLDETDSMGFLPSYFKKNTSKHESDLDLFQSTSSFGFEDEFEYMDGVPACEIVDYTQNGQHFAGSEVCQFVILDRNIASQISESISSSACDTPNFENDSKIIFSTNKSKVVSSDKWSKDVDISLCDSHKKMGNELLNPFLGSLDEDLFCDNEISCSEIKHSTPLKDMFSSRIFISSQMISPLDIPCLLDISEEDNDIEENYLEAIWSGNKATLLPACGLLVKQLNDHQEIHLSHSMICPSEDFEVVTQHPYMSLHGTIRMAQDNFFEAPTNSTNLPHVLSREFDVHILCEFPSQTSPHTSPTNCELNKDILSTCSTLHWNKDSYRDKLMESLRGTVSKIDLPNIRKKQVQDIIAKSSTAIKCTVDTMNCRDTEHNFSLDNSIVDGNELPKHSLKNKCEWNEQKVKKKGIRVLRTTALAVPETSVSESEYLNATNISLDSIKSKKFDIDKQCETPIIFKQSSKQKDLCSSGSNSRKSSNGEPKRIIKDESKNFTPSLEVLQIPNNESIKPSTQFIKKRSRKLKKFSSLDHLSSYHEDFEARATRSYSKWKSQDDLGLPDLPTLKVENRLLWPLLGLVVFAGFVAFCFREKISFMIASKFPFERPPT